MISSKYIYQQEISDAFASDIFVLCRISFARGVSAVWEIVSQQPEAKRRAEKPDLIATSDAPAVPVQAKPLASHNFLIWGQILICIALGAAVFAAKACQAPFWPALRVGLTSFMQQQDSLLSEERQLSRFRQSLQQVEQAWNGFTKKAQNASPPQLSEACEKEPEQTARIRHSQSVAKALPAGCSTQKAIPQWQAVQPLAGVLTINSGYGWRTDPTAKKSAKAPTENESSDASVDFHTGIDLAASEGTFVYAVADGIVQKAKYGNSYGYYAVLWHPDGSQTIYAHLKYLFVHSGQAVAAGTPLGVSGQTGNVTGPHLHFELLCKGVRYDPSGALGLAAKSR